MLLHQQIILWAVVTCPLLSVLLQTIFGKRRHGFTARMATFLISAGFVLCLLALISVPSSINNTSTLLTNQPLSLVMATLILLVSSIIHQFSLRYLAGDRKLYAYFIKLSALTLSTVIMALSDHLLLFGLCWTCSNGLLVLLMIHKKEWRAAKQAGILAAKYLLSGSCLLVAALLLLYHTSGSLSISQIGTLAPKLPSLSLGLSVVLLGCTALIQSAQWPFHRWLTSSLNSPTPVSALMHAGLVNGGGFLIVKFADLFSTIPQLLLFLFTAGALTAVVATSWKLIQTDIKRMLACSTMAQMGFMMMQCGLGLYASALAHLCWHGLFKAYLFLSSGSAVQAPIKSKTERPVHWPTIVTAFLGGLLSSMCFALITDKQVFILEADSFLLAFAFMAGAQLTYTLLDTHCNLFNTIAALGLASLAGSIYGLSIQLLKTLVPTLNTPFLHLNWWHGAVLLLFILLWLAMFASIFRPLLTTTIGSWVYMRLLNGSQPHPDTLTTIRNSYRY